MFSLKNILFIVVVALGWNLFAAVPQKAQVAVVQATTACLPADRGYAASRAKWTYRSLADGGVKADLIGDASLARDLLGRRLVFLVTCQKPTTAQLAALKACRARGGKIAVLQSYSPPLASFMGVSVAPFTAKREEPVCVVAATGGWWSANLFASDDAEEAKVRLLLGLVDSSLPGSRRVATWEAKQRARVTAAQTKARAQRPRAGEIHAVWDQTGEGLYLGDWPRTMRFLKANGVTDLFVNVAGAGFAHYPSRVLPASERVATRGDALAACLAAARPYGIRVHAWILCFNATHASPARLASLAKRGWRVKDKAGRLTPYLDPSNADVRWHLLMAIDELAAKYAIAGVHLDFVRGYENAAKKPAARNVETFVAAARKRMRAKRPAAWLTAAVMPSYPSCVSHVGQDWEAWLAKGLLDYAVPMNYVEDAGQYAAFVARQGRTPAQARRLLSGIGVTANESRLTALQVIDQINAARAAGFAGEALFDLDRTLEKNILPLLHLGLWK